MTSLAENLTNCWIIAGERSGDLYGAELAMEIRKRSGGSAKLRGMGGEKMRAAGVDLMVDSSELAVMGFLEVLTLLPKFIAVMNKLINHAEKEKPDCVVLIDFPGFNLRLAQRLHARGIRVVYYISPKVWSWKADRIKKIAACCDKLLCIFPFEIDFYKNRPEKVNAIFTGNPLIPILKRTFKKPLPRNLNTVLILPGSRSSEIKHCFSRMLPCISALYQRRRELHFIVAATDERKADKIQAMMNAYAQKDTRFPLGVIEVRCDQTMELIQTCGTALATSGTVTLECAIAGLPLVSIYAGATLSFYIAMKLVKLYRNFFTLPNIIADKCIYEEYFQMAVHPYMIVPALERILPGGERRDYVVNELAKIPDLLEGEMHDPIRCAVDAILN